LLDVNLFVFHQFFFECAPDAVGLLQPGVLADQKLDALVLEVVIHHTLVVPGHSHAPLLELAYDPLSALLGHSRDVALSARVLETQVVAIAHKDISDGVKDRP
jgi:hypothetical protein